MIGNGPERKLNKMSSVEIITQRGLKKASIYCSICQALFDMKNQYNSIYIAYVIRSHHGWFFYSFVGYFLNHISLFGGKKVII